MRCMLYIGVLNFLNGNIQECNEFMYEDKLCFNCLQVGHIVRQCTSGSCRSIMHYYTEKLNLPSENDDNRSSSAQYCSLNVMLHSHILLPTATLRCVITQVCLHTCRALLDSCSQAHFVSESLVQKLALKKFPNSVPLQGINTVGAEVKYGATVQILPMTTNYSATLDCVILPRISGNVPGNYISYQEWNIPPDIKLADENFNPPGQINLLIGGEIFSNCFSLNKDPGQFVIHT
ncbi:hypothetical protein PR048_003378 [Dryococelus australis]|uniref:CCHC-type domain-containing protein n=1 Tax=Dryococelus australis TaxID=614101 RepID=A0ABQ9IMX6_9NEOP|nr:hypothetical protein PR048_003378 [Dryococelus australis]